MAVKEVRWFRVVVSQQTIVILLWKWDCSLSLRDRLLHTQGYHISSYKDKIF
jgi:hypothetical protein